MKDEELSREELLAELRELAESSDRRGSEGLVSHQELGDNELPQGRTRTA